MNKFGPRCGNYFVGVLSNHYRNYNYKNTFRTSSYNMNLNDNSFSSITFLKKKNLVTL